ncbi:RICIN domain-containing protein [Kitasatospora sp. MY 5-36]|uniref:RICIN domain-containing protein n=1 Tax=Kitasatospora sp. MY 5-36 TaxID=1678027 RepID=UPI00131EBD63|nr:RICIN domain-containing protein [Kitasatospora sp. MY 5-36]
MDGHGFDRHRPDQRLPPAARRGPLPAGQAGHRRAVRRGRRRCVPLPEQRRLALSLLGSCTAPLGSITDLEPARPGDPAQQWTFTGNPDGTVRISDNCATGTHRHTVLSAGASAGDSAYLLDLSPGNPWQEWKLTQDQATGSVTVTNVATGLALDAGAGTAGTPVTTRPATGQRWTLGS